MSRKDFNHAAKIVARLVDSSKTNADLLAAITVHDSFAEFFAADSQAFDRRRFLDACGFPGTGIVGGM